MALQSSGQIKFSEINTELGRTATLLHSLSDSSDGTYATINTQNAVADRPDTTQPHAISEWFSYDHSLSSYTSLKFLKLSGSSQAAKAEGQSTFLTNADDFSYTGWYRIDETSEATQHLFSLSKAATSGNDQLFFMYNGNSERLMVRYRKAGTFHQRYVSLSQTTNTAVTGVGTSGWQSNNRGNVNSDGFCMLTYTYDASEAVAATGIKMYWNDTEITVTNGSSNNLQSGIDYGSVNIGDLASSGTFNANCFNGGIDEVKMYKRVLSGSDITALYNSGVPTDSATAGVTADLVGEYDFETNGNNKATGFPNLTVTGTLDSY